VLETFKHQLKIFITFARKRKWWILGLLLVLVLGWGSGFATGWWWSHGRLGSFAAVDSSTKLLVLSPHPDDEVLIAGGLIQRVLNAGGKVKVVYLTTGDSSIGSVIRLDKNLKLSPSEFIDLANRRHDEAIRATAVLGLKTGNLVFLGFPDQGLGEVLQRETGDGRGAVVSRSTKLDHVAYSWAYKPGQGYYKDEFISDLTEIISSFGPTMILTTHTLDFHPDHKAAGEVAEIIKNQTKSAWRLYFSLVHYRDYPPRGGYLFPPEKLFNDRWYSLELTSQERQTKKAAIDSYSSQVEIPEEGWYMRFDSTNEIFELE
jgi:LmbE family N-acetylglucosaminyl deacetylase